ncbi:pentapeptide repeat-containing protein [Escherichia coli]|nr:pentapeptide repeat-containing protein [Escherichia coli]
MIKDEDLSNSNFAGCRLQNAIFQDCNMYKTNFYYAIMEKYFLIIVFSMTQISLR